MKLKKSPSTIVNMKKQTSLILFFDAECLVCHRWVEFVLKRDPHHQIAFAPLRGTTAKEKLKPDLIQGELKTLVFLEGKSIFLRSEAVFKVCTYLGWPWNLMSLFKGIPRKIRDAAYDFFSDRRFAWFGKVQQCKLLTVEERRQFLS